MNGFVWGDGKLLAEYFLFVYFIVLIYKITIDLFFGVEV